MDMIIDSNRKWWLMQIYLMMMPTVELQIPMPVYPMGPQIFALPPPPPIAVPFPVPFPVRVTEETTTTTTERSSDKKNNKGCFLAIPAPYPVPVPVYPPQPPMGLPPPPACVNSPRPKNCPQCPPCGPPPMPPPMPAPVYPFMPYPILRPSVIIPFPPPRISEVKQPSCKRKPPRHKLPHRYPSKCQSESESDYSDDSDDGTSESDSSNMSSEESSASKSRDYNRRKKRKKVGHALKRPRSRRNVLSDSHISDNALVKPVLSYVSKDGNVKFKQRISKAAALDLMNGRRSASAVKKASDIENNETSKAMSDEIIYGLKVKKHPLNEISPNSRSLQLSSGDGRKEIIFKAPDNKKMSNLTVSFQIT